MEKQNYKYAIVFAGEMGQELLLTSARVRPARLVESGFEYQHEDLESALRHVLGRELETPL